MVRKCGVDDTTDSAANVSMHTITRVGYSILVIRCQTSLFVICSRFKCWIPVAAELIPDDTSRLASRLILLVRYCNDIRQELKTTEKKQ
jgi:hypothetical protein